MDRHVSDWFRHWCWLLLAPWCLGMRPGNPVLPHEAFWEGPPQRDPQVVFLWRFGGEGEQKSNEAEKELTTGGGAEATDDEPLTMVAQPKDLSYALLGDAKVTPEGRFGSGLALAGKGRLECAKCGLKQLLEEYKTLTLEFWVCPAPEAPAAVLLSVPAAVAALKPLTLERAADGQLSLNLGDNVLLRHARAAPAGQWTHLALALGGGQPLTLLVNGTPQPLTEARAFGVFFERSAKALILGSDPAGGRGLRGRLDEIRLCRNLRNFYELADDSFRDPERARTVAHAPPFFARKGVHVACSFDGTVKPEVCQAFGAAGQDVPAAFAPGVRGQALDLRQADQVQFALLGSLVFPAGQGTLEFWFRPTDWNNLLVSKDYFGRDITSFVLATVAAKGAPQQVLRGLRVITGVKGDVANSKTRWVLFQPGQWTHVVMTWGGGRPDAVYLDGLPQQIGQIHFEGPSPAGKQAFAAWQQQHPKDDDDTWRFTFARTGTLVDELRVYPYSFSADEAHNAYRCWLPDGAAQMRRLPPIIGSFGYVAHSWDMVERLNISINCLPFGDQSPATVAITGYATGQTETYCSVPEVKLNDFGQGACTVTKAFPFGKYEFAVVAKGADGKELGHERLPWERVKPVWWQNDLGKERQVPPPWTPIAVAEGKQLQVWGRTIVLEPTGLPTSITAVERPLLAAPAVIRVTAGGAESVLTGKGVTFTEQAPDRVTWKASATGGAVAAEVEVWMEFDGLMYYTVRLHPAGAAPVTVEKLVVDFPTPAATVTQYIANSGGHNFRGAWDCGFIPTGAEGTVWSTLKPRRGMERAFPIGNYCPNIWVGGDHCGLNFSGDNDQGWTPDNAVAAQELVRAGDRVIYRMNVISQPVAIAPERTFTFIVLPTPTKPLPPDWRGWNRAPAGVPNAVLDGIDAFLGFAITNDVGAVTDLTFKLEPVSFEVAATQMTNFRAKIGEKSPRLMYIDYSWPRLGPSMDEYGVNPSSLWAGTGRLAWTREVEDYFVYTMNEYFKRDILEGLYIDDTSMGKTFSLASTAYPFAGVPEGRRVGFNSMGFRRFLKRCYNCILARGRTPIIVPHMTYCFEMPALSFCVAAVNGEDRDIMAFDEHRDAIGTWSLTELRVMGSGPKWGFATFWKPTVYPPQNPLKDRDMIRYWIHWQSRAMHALIVPHDIWFFWHYPTGNTILPAFCQFGMQDPELRFLPYWENQACFTLAAPEKEQVLVSIWVKKDAAMLMLSNLSKKEQAVTLTAVPEKIFGGAAGEVTWKDIDSSLEKPEDPRAAAKGATAASNTQDLAGVGDEKTTDEELLDRLEGKDPRAKERERLAPKAKGPEVQLIIRGHDYRLLELRRK